MYVSLWVADEGGAWEIMETAVDLPENETRLRKERVRLLVEGKDSMIIHGEGKPDRTAFNRAWRRERERPQRRWWLRSRR